MVLPAGFEIAAITEREDPRDAFVSNHYGSLDALPTGSRIGTSSLRRESQARARFPQLVVGPLRGNVQTRLKKLDAGDYAAIILAAAGLKRLGLAERITAILTPDESLPAPGQGALGIECRAERTDVIAMMRTDHIQPFIERLQEEFFIDEEMIAESIQHNLSFNIIHRDTMFKVDVFIPQPRSFHQSQLARAQKQTFSLVDSEVSANFSSAEDTILSKLEWYRLGGEVSERQWRDTPVGVGVLKTRSGELDLDYLHKWAKELKVSDLLERALKQAGT